MRDPRLSYTAVRLSLLGASKKRPLLVSAIRARLSGSGGTGWMRVPPKALGCRSTPPAVTLLLSDGANSAGGDPFIPAERARQLRVPVFTIALGTAGGVLRQPNAFGGTRIQPVPPDPDSLARIAETSNGRFFEAPSSDNLTAVYDSLGSRIGFRMEEREVTVAFTAAGLLLLAVAGALRARRGARLP